MDKYWITFSQWPKSSAAAGFEAACGVVKHFKGSCVTPFESMVNRGIPPERPACVRSLPLFSADSPRLSLPARNETVCLHLRPCRSLFHPSPQPQLSNRLYLQPSWSYPLSLTVSLLLFQRSRGHLGFRLLLSCRPIDGFLSLLMQPASAKAREIPRCLSVSMH